MSVLLNKSDFKLARSCYRKLIYRKQGFPSTNDRNRFLALLADSGLVVQALARLYFPQGILPPDSTTALNWTQHALQLETVTLFEAPFETASRHIRADILIKKGNNIQLIEVKSRGVDVEEINGNPHRRRRALSKIKDLLEDLAYQKLVIQACHPDFEISCHLMMPDKNRVNPIDRLADRFRIKSNTDNQYHTFIDAEYFGNVDEVLSANLLTQIDVTFEVDALLDELDSEAYKLEILLQNPEKIEPEIGCHCRDCEFSVRSENQPLSGFELCWKAGAHTEPHILSLGQLGNVNLHGEVDELIAQGESSIHAIPEMWLKGKWGNRPWLQLTQQRDFMFEGFHKSISGLSYPMFFIDFETTQPAIPNYRGMKPYQKVLFQWSCHRVDFPGAEPVHTAWLHDSKEKPNAEFLSSLIAQLGEKGTIMTWSAYEQGILKGLLSEIEITETQKDWIRRAFHRITDMNQLAVHYYFHPQTGGRTSIKVTLPAILKSVRSKRTVAWLKELDVYKLDENQELINPYYLLPELGLPGTEGSINDGSGAMIAYQYLQLSIENRESETYLQYRNALLRYCQLDTLAMLIIYEEWLLMEESKMPS